MISANILAFYKKCFVSLIVLRRGRYEKFSHPFKKCFVLLFNRCEISQSTSLVCQRPCWHTTPCRSFLQPMWDLTIHPSWRSASSLAHHPVSGSDTICNNSSSPLADIVRFVRFSPLVILFLILNMVSEFSFLTRYQSFSFLTVTYCHRPHDFKICLLRRNFYTGINNASFPLSPINLGRLK